MRSKNTEVHNILKKIRASATSKWLQCFCVYSLRMYPRIIYYDLAGSNNNKVQGVVLILKTL